MFTSFHVFIKNKGQPRRTDPKDDSQSESQYTDTKKRPIGWDVPTGLHKKGVNAYGWYHYTNWWRQSRHSYFRLSGMEVTYVERKEATSSEA